LIKSVISIVYIPNVNDNTKFNKINSDPTHLRERQLQRFLRKLKGKGLISNELYNDIYPSGSQPARMYGLPKLHKVTNNCTQIPFRPIVSSLGTYNYKLAKYLCDLLTPHLPSSHCAKDTFTFVEDIKKVRCDNSFLVSFNVESLFTNIPLDETIDLAVDTLLNSNKVKFERNELKKLLIFATKQTHFLFNNELFDQIDGVAMGSPLDPVLANLFIGHHEEQWLKTDNAKNVLFYRRYVDDILCLFPTENDVLLF